MRQDISKDVAILGMYTSLMLIASYIESFITFPLLTPGIKLGIGNSFVIYLLYRYGCKRAFVVSTMRVILAGFMFGNAFTIIYSLVGAIMSLFLMYVAKMTGLFSVIGVSVLGALGHNIGQLIVAMVLLKTMSVSYYFTILMISGVVTGIIVGRLTISIIKRVYKIN